MKKGIAVSDIHMFSRRSTYAQNLSLLDAKIAESNICVLNGDIFDFRWSALPSVFHAMNSASQWLDELLGKYPNVEFFYVCGNHDSSPLFRSRLADLSTKHKNLSWHPYFIRIGPHLFLHGDIVDSSKRGQSLDIYRKSFHGEKKKGWLMNVLYDLLIASRLHKIIFFIHKEPQLAQIIMEYLQAEAPELLEGLENIFFGHTHVPFKDFIYEGIAFHNCGSMIRGLPSNIFEFEV